MGEEGGGGYLFIGWVHHRYRKFYWDGYIFTALESS